MILLTLCFFVALVFISAKCVKKLAQHVSMYKTVQTMSGPNECSLIGVALKVAGLDAMFNYLMNLSDVYGSPVKFWYGPASLVVMIDMPEDIKAVLNSENCLDKAPFYNFLNSGKALIVAKKEMWKVHYKILSRAFNKNLLESSFPVINEESKKIVKALSGKIGSGEIDVLHTIVEGVLEMIFKNFLDLQWDDDIRAQYIENSKK